MTTTYTDAQIEDVCVALLNQRQCDHDGMECIVSREAACMGADMLRKLLSERQAAMQGQGGEVLSVENRIRAAAISVLRNKKMADDASGVSKIAAVYAYEMSLVNLGQAIDAKAPIAGASS